MFNPVRYFFCWVSAHLSTHGLIDRDRGERIADLAWPRFLTMFARHLNKVADVSMIGLSIGSTGVAGLAFAAVYWSVANGFSLGIAGGTITQVSQRFGADRGDEIDLAVKQSVWIGLALVTPFVLAYWIGADPLIGLFTDDSDTQAHGAAYLQILGFGLLFTMLNLIASRTLAGADDTWIAMAVRATGAFANIVFNAVFIFGLGMGAAGAALGTVLAEALITMSLAWGFLYGRLPVIGEFPVRLSVGPPYLDLPTARELTRMIRPLVIQRLGRSLVRFPLFLLLAVFGPTVVAAFEAARRIRQLLGAFGAGFSLSASSVIGQELGRGEETMAERYSLDVIRLSGVVYLIAAAAVFALAPWIARLFAEDLGTVSQTVPFVRVAAISFLGYGLNQTFEGILKAAGDNRWSMYGRLAGQYLVLLPLVYLGTVTPLGILAVYVAFVAEMWAAMFITGYRFLSGAWIEVGRTYRPAPTTD
jgi:putative MATE family efflux protein